MAHKKDFYELLEIPKTATDAEIKAAYRKLALKYHPDRNPDNKEAEEKFKEIAQAYAVLSDPEKRKAYDQFGHAGTEGMGGFGAQDINMEDLFGQFGDIFGSIFGQEQRGKKGRKKAKAPMPRQGHDLSYEMNISLKEAFLGTKKEIRYYHFVVCDSCKGKGLAPNATYQECPVCHGVGEQRYQQGFFSFSQTCSNCAGEGYIIPNPCKTCGGQGRIQKHDVITPTIPKGIFDGAELRVAGAGDAGIFGGPAGNLYIKIHVQPDKIFKRVGDNLETTVMLTYPQLVFGSQIEIESIDGHKETIKIPKGCASGYRIAITGKGFFNLNTKRTGDLVIITQCHIPKKLAAEAEQKLKEYSNIIGTNISDEDGTIKSFFKKFLG